ncbi:MAG: hypothetical protein CM15mV10_1330 [uncultured marine virus]|nr:MAG: hypothetical protein CM15mV10_1330 [uncultured marine virus]
MDELYFPFGNRANEREVYVQGRKNYAYDVSGVNILDYLDLYRKFTYSNQESYRLDHIAHVELGQRKVDHSEYENFKDFYTSDWQKFIEYNIQDTELIDRLEEKMKLLDLAITMSYDAKVNFEDVLTGSYVDTMIYNYLTDRNIVVPLRRVQKKMKSMQVPMLKNRYQESMIGWLVLTLIVCILTLSCSNISPETLWETRHASASVERILNEEITIEDDVCVCANGAQYRKDIQGFLPEMMDKIYKERTSIKRKCSKQNKHMKNTD